MVAISATPKGKTSNGRRIVDAFILSDDDPQSLPTDGSTVDGLMDEDLFAPFSIIYVLNGSKIYIANESGVFTAQ